ncbi:unnamed protein product [Closterium sp. NIES-54]
MGSDRRKPSEAHPIDCASSPGATIGEFPCLPRSSCLPPSHPSRASCRFPLLARFHSVLTRRSSKEAASTEAEAETIHHPTEAGKEDAATVTAAVSIQAAEAEEAKKPDESKKNVSSFLELLAQEDSVASSTVKAVASSAKVAAWLGMEAGSEHGGNVGAETSSGWSSLSRSESSCSSSSACLIHLSSDSSSTSSSSSAHSLCSSPTGLTAEVPGVKRGIG